MEVQTLKRHFQTHSASDTGMTTHSLNFPHSVQDIIMFKLCLFLGGTMPKSLYHHSDLYSVNPFNLEILLKSASSESFLSYT